MSEANDGPLACLDANVFLAALIPEATKAPKDEILGSARVAVRFHGDPPG
jgi:hypothetical protein